MLVDSSMTGQANPGMAGGGGDLLGSTTTILGVDVCSGNGVDVGTVSATAAVGLPREGKLTSPSEGGPVGGVSGGA